MIEFILEILEMHIEIPCNDYRRYNSKYSTVSKFNFGIRNWRRVGLFDFFNRALRIWPTRGCFVFHH